MNGGCVVVAGALDGSVAVLVEGLDTVEVEGGTKWFVQELDGRHHIGVPRVAGSQVLDGGESLADGIALLPFD